MRNKLQVKDTFGVRTIHIGSTQTDEPNAPDIQAIRASHEIHA